MKNIKKNIYTNFTFHADGSRNEGKRKCYLHKNMYKNVVINIILNLNKYPEKYNFCKQDGFAYFLSISQNARF